MRQKRGIAAWPTTGWGGWAQGEMSVGLGGGTGQEWECRMGQGKVLENVGEEIS